MIPDAASASVAPAFIAMHPLFEWGVLATFGLGLFFGYIGLLVFLEFYESRRPKAGTETRRELLKAMSICALWGAFVIGLISVASYLNR